MRNCYKCCHTNGRKRIKNDGDTTIEGCLSGDTAIFYSVLYRMLTIDETFVGGKNINRHKDKKVEKYQGHSYKDKVPVFGALERNGKIIAMVVPNTQTSTLVSIVRRTLK